VAVSRPHRRPWIGVDLDRTLAKYDGFKGLNEIGEPIPLMLARVKKWLSEGKEVRIVTARVAWSERRPGFQEILETKVAIWKWCEKHVGQRLQVTCTKDADMIELWDDRAVQVVPNTGQRVDGNP
jgi:hypothetical protein